MPRVLNAGILPSAAKQCLEWLREKEDVQILVYRIELAVSEKDFFECTHREKHARNVAQELMTTLQCLLCGMMDFEREAVFRDYLSRLRYRSFPSNLI